MGKNATKTPPETEETIINRHKEKRDASKKFINQARDATRKLAIAQGIAIPNWESYWEDLDDWKNFIMEQEIDRELFEHDLAPGGLSTTPIPRLPKPDNLEQVGGNSND